MVKLVLFSLVTMAESVHSDLLRLVSFNSRGYNESKKSYICSILSGCDLLFLQEHWLSDAQLACLNDLSRDHVALGVSGFGNSEVLSGRPYGGCAIVWRSSLNLLASPIESGSRRVCAVLFSSSNIRLLCICAYMPYEHDADSCEEFLCQLAVIDSLLDRFSDCQVILGGDFNVDFLRNWSHTELLNDFCVQSNLFPVIRHSSSTVDYTYHFSMKHFTCIDHFIVSETLFQSAVKLQYVLHDVDNTSDHEPVCMLLDINVARVNIRKRVYKARPSWNKATADHIAAYKSLLHDKLSNITVPRDAVLCKDFCCCNTEHTNSISSYVSQLAEACIQSATATIPSTKRVGERGCIPGWTEHVAPLRDKSIFWHKLWIDCGRPHAGLVADIMRKTRLQYHAAIRAVRRNEADIVNERLASCFVTNNNRDFWSEIKRMRGKSGNVSNVVDGLSNPTDIAEAFAGNYSTLYTSVSYDVNEMSGIRSTLNEASASSESQLFVSPHDVLCAFKLLKAGKSDGSFDLVSDHVIHACDEFGVCVSMLLSALLVHGFAPEDVASCTIIPIPKGKNVNVSDSSKYRGIALSSIFSKVFDLILLNKFYDCLCTSERQFGFKRHHSTDMCTMVLKESLAYYTVDGGSAFCALLDATKAFDRVNYCKLFRILLDRDIPAVYLRLLLNFYTNSVACVSWNGVCSQRFTIENGVRQGGIISPILFCVYIDGLLCRLYESGVGCFIGHVYTGALAYADDVVLLAPTPSAMRIMLKICEDFAKEFSVVFNASKSVCLMVSKGTSKASKMSVNDLQFTLDGNHLAFVDECSHLGHVLTSRLDDNSDILSRRNSLCGKVNNVLCYFSKCDPLVKSMLLRSYCSDLYGCVLWDLSHPCIDNVCIAWRKGLRRALGLPWRTHSYLLAPVTDTLPLRDELFCRTAMFLSKCVLSENSIVNFVSRHGVYFRRMSSPIGLNAQLCCARFDLPLSSLTSVNRSFVRRNVFLQLDAHCSTVSVIRDMLCVKSSQAEIVGFATCDVDFILESLCVS